MASGDDAARTRRSPRAGGQGAHLRPRPDARRGAALYISSILCGERRTQREVADVAGVTEVTIRNRYKELEEKLDIDIVDAREPGPVVRTSLANDASDPIARGCCGRASSKMRRGVRSGHRRLG